jgi:cytoskeleton protein RodZ
MPSIGEKLRQERESQGRKIADVAAEIKISATYLQAIEEGDLAPLPGAFFARSFVRQYAKTLGIPERSIESEMEAWLSTAPAEPAPTLQPRDGVKGLAPVVHVMEGGRRPRRKLLGALAALIVVVGGCAAFYSFWLKRQTAEAVPAAPPEPVEQAATAPPSPEPEIETPPPPPVSEADDAETTGFGPEEVAPVEEPVPAGPLWFEIAASEETWVRVRNGNTTLFSGILQDGESRRFEGLEQASLRVGNAGGLELAVNGEPGRPIGPRGSIRLVTLTPNAVNIAAPPRVPPRPVVNREQVVEEPE